MSQTHTPVDFPNVRAAFAVALHMHQPLIPAGGDGDLATAPVISNLRHMLEHPEIPDAHNATPFLNCYRRMGEFIPQLVAEGHQPRVMLDYSGCLLYGLREMGRADVIDALRPLAQDAAYQNCVEWLGTAWGHAVAPSTPPQDFRRHVIAWREQFAADFGRAALARVRGFSPPEMALPNHPDVAHAFVRTLLDCGFEWVLVQEHSVERFADGTPLRRPHIPHRLIAQNSAGETAEITAIVKTRGSDTKLVGQMQPAAEAEGLARVELAGREIPQLVTQISDGENGGVMMNEFPAAYLQAMRHASNSATPPMNVSEYLAHLAAAGVCPQDFPPIRPVFQHRIFSRFDGGGPAKLAAVIEQLRHEGHGFHVEGGSWTDDRSWIRGYEGVLGPMEAASERFAERTTAGFGPAHPKYREALFHLLAGQTSCFRYWGQGTWTDYGRELCRRAVAILDDVSAPAASASTEAPHS